MSLVADNPMGREALASEKANRSGSKRVGESPSLIAARPSPLGPACGKRGHPGGEAGVRVQSAAEQRRGLWRSARGPRPRVTVKLKVSFGDADTARSQPSSLSLTRNRNLGVWGGEGDLVLKLLQEKNPQNPKDPPSPTSVSQELLSYLCWKCHILNGTTDDVLNDCNNKSTSMKQK